VRRVHFPVLNHPLVLLFQHLYHSSFLITHHHSSLLTKFHYCKLDNDREGLVLIEDLRASGVFAAQPKSQYSTRATRRHDVPILTPHVMMDHHDPTEDFRTNVEMNLEGF
jgi:hypothetical protein